MDTDTRIKLVTADNVREFCRTHPFETEGPVAAVKALGDGLDRARALAEQAGAGRIGVRAAIVSRTTIRREVMRDLRLLDRIARATAKEQPEMSERLKLPGRNASQEDFLTAARVALADATNRVELLTRYGLPAGFLEKLGARLVEYQLASDARNAAFARRVGASAELATVTADIMATMRLLDAFNQYRYAAGSEELAAWRSASNIAWPVEPRPLPPASTVTQPSV